MRWQRKWIISKHLPRILNRLQPHKLRRPQAYIIMLQLLLTLIPGRILTQPEIPWLHSVIPLPVLRHDTIILILVQRAILAPQRLITAHLHRRSLLQLQIHLVTQPVTLLRRTLLHTQVMQPRHTLRRIQHSTHSPVNLVTVLRNTTKIRHLRTTHLRTLRRSNLSHFKTSGHKISIVNCQSSIACLGVALAKTGQSKALVSAEIRYSALTHAILITVSPVPPPAHPLKRQRQQHPPQSRQVTMLKHHIQRLRIIPARHTHQQTIRAEMHHTVMLQAESHTLTEEPRLLTLQKLPSSYVMVNHGESQQKP